MGLERVGKCPQQQGLKGFEQNPRCFLVIQTKVRRPWAGCQDHAERSKQGLFKLQCESTTCCHQWWHMTNASNEFAGQLGMPQTVCAPGKCVKKRKLTFLKWSQLNSLVKEMRISLFVGMGMHGAATQNRKASDRLDQRLKFKKMETRLFGEGSIKDLMAIAEDKHIWTMRNQHKMRTNWRWSCQLKFHCEGTLAWRKGLMAEATGWKLPVATCCQSV